MYTKKVHFLHLLVKGLVVDRTKDDVGGQQIASLLCTFESDTTKVRLGTTID